MDIDDKDLSQDEPVSEKGPPEKPQVVVDLSVEDDDADEQVQVTQETRKNRREQARDFRRQKEELQRKLSDYERQLSEIRGQLAARPQAAPTQQQTDPLASQAEALDAQYDALVLAIQAPGQSQEQVAKLVQQARKIESQRRRLETRMEIRAEREESGVSAEGGDQNSYIKQAMMAEFPQIFKNKALQARALAEATDLVEQKGRSWDLETARESGRRALAAFGMGGKPPAPTPADRARFSNTPSRAGAGGGGTGQTYAPPPFEMKLAEAWVKGRPGADTMSAEDKWRVWSKETGSRRQTG